MHLISNFENIKNIANDTNNELKILPHAKNDNLKINKSQKKINAIKIKQSKKNNLTNTPFAKLLKKPVFNQETENTPEILKIQNNKVHKNNIHSNKEDFQDEEAQIINLAIPENKTITLTKEIKEDENFASYKETMDEIEDNIIPIHQPVIFEIKDYQRSIESLTKTGNNSEEDNIFYLDNFNEDLPTQNIKMENMPVINIANSDNREKIEEDFSDEDISNINDTHIDSKIIPFENLEKTHTKEQNKTEIPDEEMGLNNSNNKDENISIKKTNSNTIKNKEEQKHLIKESSTKIKEETFEISTNNNMKFENQKIEKNEFHNHASMQKSVLNQTKTSLIECIKKGKNSFDFQLNPKDLGTIKLSIDFLDNKSLKISIETSTINATEALKQEAAIIENTVKELGFELNNGTLNFSFKDNTRDHQNFWRNQKPDHQLINEDQDFNNQYSRKQYINILNNSNVDILV